MEQANRTLTWALIAVLIAAILGVIVLALIPDPTGRTYSEFYILGPEGNASDYPTNLSVNEEATVIVGVSNHEGEDINYRVLIAWDDTTVHERDIPVPNEETREVSVTIVAPDDPGMYQLRFLLTRTGNGGDQMSDPLYLRVTVTR